MLFPTKVLQLCPLLYYIAKAIENLAPAAVTGHPYPLDPSSIFKRLLKFPIFAEICKMGMLRQIVEFGKKQGRWVGAPRVSTS